MMSKVIKESNGKHKGETIYCPVNGWDCPYYENGICYIKDPMEECDDFAACFDSWEEWEEL
jgi:hypothetical protein